MRERIKRFIWNFFSYDFEMGARFLLDPNFRKEQARAARQMEEWLSAIEARPRKKKIRVVFFCYSPAMWSACMSTFQAARADDRLEAYILALPPKIPGENFAFSQEEYGENLAYQYCVSFCANTVNAYDPEKQTWIDLRTLSPDYVILSRPYDKEVCPQYHIEALAQYTKVCYIPYAYCKMGWDSRLVYAPDFLKYAYAVFSESARQEKILQGVYNGLFRAKRKKILHAGYTKFDLHRDMGRGDRRFEKTVLWLPRWTTRELLEPSTFFRYRDQIVRYFQEHPQFRLICRPHPMMFANFISTGEMTEREANDFRGQFAAADNLFLDESGDHISMFAQADIFISDTSSLLVEEFVTGKPIIFCGSMRHFDREAKRWAEAMYHADDWRGLSAWLQKLLDGCDPGRARRQRLADELLGHDGKCGERIVAFLKRDYFGDILEKEIDV